MKHPILAALILTSCAPQPLVPKGEKQRIVSFAVNCVGSEAECQDLCNKTFAVTDETTREKADESWAICSDAVAMKFRAGERT